MASSQSTDPRVTPDLDGLLAHVSEVVLCYGADGRLTWASPSLESSYGYACAEVVGTKFRFGPRHRITVMGKSMVGQRPQVTRSRLRVNCRDGTSRWADVVVSHCWGDPGQLAYTIVVLREVPDVIAARSTTADAQAMLDLVVENTTDIVFLSVAGVTQWVSPSLTALTGWAPSDFISHTTIHLWHPDDRQRAMELRDAAYAGSAGRGELRLRCRDGHYVWLDVLLRPASDVHRRQAAVGILRDATERKSSAQALAGSERRFHLLGENATDIVFEIDTDGRIAWMSSGVRDTLGWNVEDLVGLRGLDFVHPDDARTALGLREAALAGAEPASGDVRFRSRTGEYRRMSAREQCLRDADGNSTGFVVGLRDVQDERNATTQLAFLAFHDELTGLRNRHWILDMLDTDLAVADREGTRLAVLFLDLDNFKVVNDSLGHVAGDDVLVAAAHRILASLRPGDRVGRFGGDEFIVIAPGISDDTEVDAIAARLNATVAAEAPVAGRAVTVSCSIGIAVSNSQSTAMSMLRDADLALFRAKAAGRARWEVFDPTMHTTAMTRLITEAELRSAIIHHQFVVHYQPIVALADAAVVGYEALVRWDHPERGLIPPMQFFAVAEETGLIIEIGDQVLNQVCDILTDRPDITVPISINKSPVQLACPGWHDRFVSLIQSRCIDPHRLIIEITETATLSVLERTKADLTDLRDQGIGIHVDDFGTGYSSIALLRDLPVTGLKLDLSFTKHLTTDPTARALAAGLAGLAEGLNLDGIAEGIETIEQADVLRAQGWVYGQGYLYGAPSPMRER